MISQERQAEIASRFAAYEKKYGIKIDDKMLKSSSKELAEQDPVTWGMKYRALRGEPYRFELPLDMRSEDPMNDNYIYRNRHRPFLKQMIADQTQNKCEEKSRQCGASESAVTEVLWFLSTHPGTKAMYTFPSNQQMEDFSNSRIKACMDESPHLQSLKGDPDNVKLKKIGKNSYLFMRSAQNSRLGEGVDADALFVDEKDRMPDKIEAAFEQSLSSSRWKFLREFSTPTLPGVGVDKSYQASCQYRWFVKCASGHSQTMTYDSPTNETGLGNIGQNRDVDPTEDTIIPGTYFYRCSHIGADGKRCISELNRWDGEWVSTYNDHRKKTHAGYHINQLACVWLTADDVMAQKLKYRFEDLFYNYVLGMPYASNAGLISLDTLYKYNLTDRWMPRVRRAEYRTVVAGIDWGYLNWVVVLGFRFDGKVEVVDWKYFIDDADTFIVSKAVGEFLEPYNPNLIVADLGYGRDRTQDLLKRFPERVFACTYTSGEYNDRSFEPIWNETGFRVSVNRTAHIRNMLQTIKLGKLYFPGPRDEYQLMFKHLMNLALIHEEEENLTTHDLEIVERIGKKGDDHLAHALAYACLALEKLTAGGTFSWRFF